MKFDKEKDEVSLEDKTQRVKVDLLGDLEMNKIFTGDCAAVLGSLNEKGRFEVRDFVHASRSRLSIF